MIYKKKEGANFFGGLLGVHLKSVQADMSPNDEEISHTFTNSIFVGEFGLQLVAP